MDEDLWGQGDRMGVLIASGRPGGPDIFVFLPCLSYCTLAALGTNVLQICAHSSLPVCCALPLCQMGESLVELIKATMRAAGNVPLAARTGENTDTAEVSRMRLSVCSFVC